MHLRVSTIRRERKVYRYAQLVESYRRERDGMPTHRVVASLGDLPPSMIANLRVALKAGREGRAVVLRAHPEPLAGSQPVRANLRYLDVALMLEVWRRWGLGGVLQGLWSEARSEVDAADVVAALVIQRCVSPGSKLYAERWFPTTSLPELLGIPPGKFNNTRIHRVLDQLEGVELPLQETLAERYRVEQGAFAALFLDVTDTWFVGRGPALAEKNKTKEGLYRRRVGIVLLCSQDGYPVRWAVVRGKGYEAHVMASLADEIKELGWTREVPMVCDRIMGRAGSVQSLAGTGVWFLTATPSAEYETYTHKIPWQATAALSPRCTEESREEDLRSAARAVLEAGMHQAGSDESLFVLDVGIMEKRQEGRSTEVATGAKLHDAAELSRGAAVLSFARRLATELDDDAAVTYSDLAKRHGCTKQHIYEVLRVLRLPKDIQDSVLHGDGQDLSLRQLMRLASSTDPQQARQEYDRVLADLIRTSKHRSNSRRPTAPRWTPMKDREPPVRLRGVVYFNPEIFVDQCRLLEHRVEEVYGFARELNRRLRNAKAKQRSKSSILSEVGAKLRKVEMSDTFEVKLRGCKSDDERREHYYVELQRDERAWQRKRKYLGFTLLLAHPDLPHDAPELCRLYRAKDTVEKDFQVIKSVLELRPVRHRTDPKVRAHVTLCMLALLLERSLEKSLRQTAYKRSASAALEVLGTCHLNQIVADPKAPPIYSVTRCTEEQRALLRAVGMEALADDEDVAANITPR